MKKSFLSILGIFALASSFAAEAITLPNPTLNASTTLYQAMQNRHTTRTFSPIEPDKKMQYITDLLWCATGSNRPDGKRVTPAAIARYAASLYVADANAIYRFDRENNTLSEVAHGNYLNACASNAKMCETSTFALIFVLDENVWEQSKRQDYAALEVGAMMQNVYLGCAALHLGTCACGSFDQEKLTTALQLSSHQKVYLTMVVGKE